MPSSIGMSVPGASSLGMDLTSQVNQETDEERRKRLLATQQSRILPTAGSSALGLAMTGYSAVTG